MFCTRCGTKRNADDRFCRGCGSELESQSEAAAPSTGRQAAAASSSELQDTHGVARSNGENRDRTLTAPRPLSELSDGDDERSWVGWRWAIVGGLAVGAAIIAVLFLDDGAGIVGGDEAQLGQGVVVTVEDVVDCLSTPNRSECLPQRKPNEFSLSSDPPDFYLVIEVTNNSGMDRLISADQFAVEDASGTRIDRAGVFYSPDAIIWGALVSLDDRESAVLNVVFSINPGETPARLVTLDGQGRTLDSIDVPTQGQIATAPQNAQPSAERNPTTTRSPASSSADPLVETTTTLQSLPRLPTGNRCGRTPEDSELVHCPGGIQGRWDFWIRLPQEFQVVAAGEFGDPHDLEAHSPDGFVISSSDEDHRTADEQFEMLKAWSPSRTDSSVSNSRGSQMPSVIYRYEVVGDEGSIFCRLEFVAVNPGTFRIQVCHRGEISESTVQRILDSAILDL